MGSSYVQSSLIGSFPKFTHGYSTRALGDMRLTHNRKGFLQTLNLSPDSLVLSEQIHGDRVEIIDNTNSRLLSSADAIVARLDHNTHKPLSIGVRIADCVPLIFADKKGKAIAVAHAGWKGTCKKITHNVITSLVSIGVKTDDIYVSIGPHIGMCCYSVLEDRAKQFIKEYGNDPNVASQIEGLWHLDIGYVNLLQLERDGISREHIDAAVTCTSCQHNLYYSFRKGSKETFGEMLGVIGVRYE
ncbi:MAG TPA: peptidoglycan editing factor PgeF [Patescibacteria group bacterium]|nr:peptidoglycan editing factor PgeF [Patescibacteria group bacterium]